MKIRTSAILLTLASTLAAAEPIRTAPLFDASQAETVAYQRYLLTLTRAVVREKDQRDLILTAETRRGAFLPGSGIDVPGFNRGRHQGTVTRQGDTLTLSANIGDDQWVKGDAQATYTITIAQQNGHEITGTFTGTFQGKPVSGDVKGSILGAGWNPGSKNASKSADGNVTLEFGATRTGWDRARWVVCNFPEAADFSAFDGLRVSVTTAQPRHDAWLDVAVMEDDGSWYMVRDAVSLASASTTSLVDLVHARQAEFIFNGEGTGTGMDGNFDEDFVLDRTRIRRVAIGLHTGQPVGTVSFSLTDLSWAAWKDRSPATVQATVSGKTLSVAGQETVPPGIFGFHTVDGDPKVLAELRVGSLRTCTALSFDPNAAQANKPNPEAGVDFYVTGMFDRKQQLPQAKDPEWETRFRAIGAAIGEKSKPLGDKAILEWWNEPYLDFGRMLNGFKSVPYPNDQGIKPGDPVEHHGAKLASMVWVEGRMTKDSKGKDKAVFPAIGAPPWRAPEDPAQDGGKPMLFAVDPSRISYWSGKQIGIWYTDTFIAMAKEAKAIAPQMKLVGGFGFRWHEDDWAAWDLLYKDLIDRSITWLDGVCEHHYQGYPDGMTGSYEVLVAYTDRVHGKRVPAYNTETNDLWDAPARGNASASLQAGGKYVSARRLVYNLRDILVCLKETPDKIVARAIHAKWKAKADAPADKPWDAMGINEGEYRALHLLRNLRGRLVETATSDPQVWLLSSIDPQTGSLASVVYNDAAVAKSIAVTLAAPTGTTFSGGTSEGYAIDAEGRITVDAQPVAATGASHQVTIELAPNQTRSITLKLDGTAPTTAERVRTQHFADGVLKPVPPGSTLTMPIALPGDAATAAKAWVRLAVERVGAGDGAVVIGGQTLAIPAAYTPANATFIREIPVDPKLLTNLKALTITAAGPETGNGFFMGCASVVLER